MTAYTLDHLKEMITHDAKIDPLKIDEEILAVPSLVAKYASIITTLSFEVKQQEKALARIKKEVFEHFLKADPFNYKMTEITQVLLPGHHLYQAEQTKLEDAQARLDMVTTFAKNLSARSYLLNSWLNWQKFTHGAN